MIDKGLKNSRGIGESERHNSILKMTQRGVERSFPLVPLSNPHKMVCTLKVQFRKNLGPLERGEGCVEEGQWIFFLNCDFVQGPIINAGTQSAILLLHKEKNQPQREKKRAESGQTLGTLQYSSPSPPVLPWRGCKVGSTVAWTREGGRWHSHMGDGAEGREPTACKKSRPGHGTPSGPGTDRESPGQAPRSLTWR